VRNIERDKEKRLRKWGARERGEVENDTTVSLSLTRLGRHKCHVQKLPTI
jgi:hypothetical protein